MRLPSRIKLLRRAIMRRIVPEFVWAKTVSIDGVKVRVRGQPYSFGVKLSLTRGVYELAERELLSKFFKPGLLVLEMGGSIGVLAAVVAEKVGPEGRLVSIEADADIAGYSSGWLENNLNTQVLVGFAFPVFQLDPAISVSGFDKTRGSLGVRVTISRGGAKDGTKKNKTWDIAKVCGATGLQPDVLICDIEGAESVLLDFAPKWPIFITNILMEMHPGILQNGYSDVEKIQSTIESDGFELREVIGMSYWFSRVRTHNH